jgi:two-component system CheB/CheR fusion protein
MVIYRREWPADPVRGVMVDVTERHRAEVALRNSEKLAATGRLAATIAHEINNPMAAVTNLMYLLEQMPGLDPTAREFARIAQEELQRMAHITRQMLGFYRDTAAPVDASIPELLQNVLQLYAKRIASSGVKVETRFDKVPQVRVFPGEIRQVFSNLILNALDAVEKGGAIRVRVHPGHNWSGEGSPGVRISIADNGSGIDPALRHRIFEPFFTTKDQRGTGLGLWVCQGIVRKHGGRITVRSSKRLGRSGTCFSILLPLNAESIPTERGRTAAAD